MIKNYFILFAILSISCLSAQQRPSNLSSFLNPEFLVGISSDANTDFPDRNLQTQVFLNWGWFHHQDKHPWLDFLHTKRSGLSLGYTSLGNQEFLGEVITLQPFLEFGAFKSPKFNVHVATGMSYFTTQYDINTNPTNRAVSTDLTWAFKLFLYYDVFEMPRLKWRLGAGYVHNSNGHTSLPNQGINSFLLSLGLDTKTPKFTPQDSTQKKPSLRYYSIRAGYGINALSESINEKKSVYTLSGEYGKIYKGVLKIGFGAYVRFYDMYYDYITNNESLVMEGREFETFKQSPFSNSLNFGISGNAEVILNHIGIDIQIGLNVYKPAYALDWTLNQGWGFVPRDIPVEGGNFRLGDTNDFYFYVKKYVSARLGLKYYFGNTKNFHAHNFYVGAFINSNLGQADFTELAVGYVKTIKLKK